MTDPKQPPAPPPTQQEVADKAMAELDFAFGAAKRIAKVLLEPKLKLIRRVVAAALDTEGDPRPPR